MSVVDHAGLSAEAVALTDYLWLSDDDAERRLEQVAAARAAESARTGADVDAATIWTALGHRIWRRPAPTRAALQEALGYFDEATARLAGHEEDLSIATLTMALIGTAVTWTRMPLDEVQEAGPTVMATMRRAMSVCPTGPGWEWPQSQLLLVWGDLMAHRHLRELVSTDDASQVRERASRFLVQRPSPPEPDLARARFALALAFARLGDEKTAMAELRHAERQAAALGLPYEQGKCLDQLADLLVKRDGENAHAEAARLHLRAGAHFEVAGVSFSSASSYWTAGVLFVGREMWGPALRAFRRSVPCWERYLGDAILLAKANEATSRLTEAHQAIVLCLTRLGRLRQAAVAADAGRARRLRSFPRRFSRSFKRIRDADSRLAERYVAAVRDVRTIEKEEQRLRSGDQQPTIEQVVPLADRMQFARNALRDVQDEVRAIPGLEDTFDAATFREIRKSIPPGAIAAYVVPSPYGGSAVLVSRTTLAGIPLPQLTDRALSKTLDSAAQAYDDWREGEQQPLEDAIEDAGAWLWETFLGDVLDASRGFERLILLASDGLDFLPLHAAWTEDGDGNRTYALDVMPISLAPSAELQPPSPAERWVDGRRTLLAVAEPQPVNEIDLPAARIEAGVLQPAFDDTTYAGRAATKAAVMSAIADADVIHMACHARAEFGLPYASFLLLAFDEHLEVSDIVDLELGRHPFVFLSACETAAHDIELADEFQSLSGAFISSGASGVISTLWSVIDLPALLIMVKAYDELFKGRAPAVALCNAQRWMRDRPEDELDQDLQAMGWVPSPVREELRGRLLNETPDFRSPLNWAAHVYSGA